VITCSEVARTLNEPLAGTAPTALAWLCIEQAGPWGAKALTHSHLDRALGVELTARTQDLPVTVLLVRRPGRHADDHRTHGARSVYLAYTGPGTSWLVHAAIDDPWTLLDLDLAAVARGELPAFGQVESEPVVLVCTNARRDQCCALRGRPVAAALALERPGRVWESSHTGGHRLAPTVLSLPDGFVYGGDQAPQMTLAAARGRSSLGRPEQAAELAALRALGASTPRALSVRSAAGGWLVTDPADGTTLSVRVDEQPLQPARKESCLKGPVSSVAYVAHVVRTSG